MPRKGAPASRRYRSLASLEVSRLYARITGAEVLEHRARETLLTALKTRPGLALPELARAARLAETTTEWHLKTLLREKYVATERQGKTRCYFPSDCPIPLRRLLVALSDPGRRSLAALLLAAPGVTQKEACERLGLAHATVYHHARRLKELGILEAAREGRLVRYTLARERAGQVEEALRLLGPVS